MPTSSVSEQLLDAYDRAKVDGASIVVIHGEIGRGKTYAIQEFYDSLCERQDSGSPWQAGLVPTAVASTTQLLLKQRKHVRGITSRAAGRSTPWYWMATTCAFGFSDFDAAAADLSRQLDEFVDGLGDEPVTEVAKVLADGATDVATDMLHISTLKTIYDTVVGVSRVLLNEFESRPGTRQSTLRAHRAKLIQGALRRLRVEDSVAAKPLVVVLDDAHLSDDESLRLLSSILMPGSSTSSSGDYFPRGVAVRQSPILVVVASWPHRENAPAYAQSPFNTWLDSARRVGVPVTDVTVARGMSRRDALELSARELSARDLALTEEEREIVVGPSKGGVVNPLVVTMRIGAVARHLDASAGRTRLDEIDITRLPLSPLDPVRDLFEALPVSEKRLIAALASFGVSAPWPLLRDEPGAAVETALSEAIASGLVRRLGIVGDALQLVGFADDLSVAFFEDGGAELLPSAADELDGILRRFRPWLEDLAADAARGVDSVTTIGRVVASTLWRHGGHPALSDLTARLLVPTDERSATARRVAFVGAFTTRATAWSGRTAGGEILAVAATPRRLGRDPWARVFATPAMRRYLRDNPTSLASRMIALSESTMPCEEMKGVLTRSVDLDGELALWRLERVSGIFRHFDFARFARDVGARRPSLTRTAELVAARHEGPDAVISLLSGQPLLTQTEAVELSEAYTRAGLFGPAADALGGLLDLEEFAVKAAGLRAGDDDPAGGLVILRPFLDDSIEASMAAADIDGDVDSALAFLHPFLDVNVHARLKSSQILSRAERYEEALAMILPLEGKPITSAQQAIRSLRARRVGVPRVELLDLAKESWQAGQFADAPRILSDGLDDPAVAAVWAEYAWCLGDRDTVMEVLDRQCRQFPQLSITLGELANSAVTESIAKGWLADASADDTDLWLSRLREVCRAEGPEAMRELDRSNPNALHPAVQAGIRTLGDPRSTWNPVSKAILALELQGHVEWTVDILEPWADEPRGEESLARILVDYGWLSSSRNILFTSSNRSLAMVLARMMWHLANDDPAGASEAVAHCRYQTPQVLRIVELLTRISSEGRAGVEAGDLLFQLRQPSAAVAVLAASAKATGHSDVVKAYREARYRTREGKKRAFGRLRRRHAIEQGRLDILATGAGDDGEASAD